MIEVRIDRPPLAGAGNTTQAHALRSETVVARAIAVRLRPGAGRFVVDAASPETQWDQAAAAGAGRLASEAAIWRFTVTPIGSGRGVLHLVVSGRTLGADGVLAETQLPDQPFEVRVAPQYGPMLARIGVLLAVALGSMLLLKIVEGVMQVDVFYLAKQLLRL